MKGEKEKETLEGEKMKTQKRDTITSSNLKKFFIRKKETEKIKRKEERWAEGERMLNLLFLLILELDEEAAHAVHL